jgi:hypothetical protein
VHVLFRSAIALLLAALVAAGGVARGEDLTPRKQALLLLRVLVYDRNLKVRARDAVRVVVAFRAGDRRSEAERDEFVAAFEAVSREVVAAGLPIEVAAVPYHDAADFEVRLRAAAPTGLYVCARLDQAVKEIARISRRNAVLSAAGSKEMVEAGLAIGLVNRGLRASVVVNLSGARGEGADLDAALLGIAEVIP